MATATPALDPTARNLNLDFKRVEEDHSGDSKGGGGAGVMATPTFNRYVELLPNLDHLWWESTYNWAGLAVQVIYIIAAVAATILAGLLEPVYIPLVGMLALIYAEDIYTKGAGFFYQLAAAEKRMAEVECGVHEKLKTDCYVAIAQMKVSAPLEFRSGKLETLAPVIARALYWTERHDKLFQEQLQLTQKVENAAAQPIANHNELEADLKLRTQVIATRENMLIAKVHAAYFRAIVINPYLKGDIHTNVSRAARDPSALCTIDPIAAPLLVHDRGLSASLQVPLRFPVFLETRDKKQLLRERVANLAIDEITKELLDVSDTSTESELRPLQGAEPGTAPSESQEGKG
ncbi:MAG: hypothetical protein HYX48_06255 [Chlamydiales bacterium]|nr:hypothetical protein [Chlamydiales bacterium]